MSEYQKLVEKLEKTYMVYVKTGNKESNVAKLLTEAAQAIEILEWELEQTKHHLDIAEGEIVRRNKNGCQD